MKLTRLRPGRPATRQSTLFIAALASLCAVAAGGTAAAANAGPATARHGRPAGSVAADPLAKAVKSADLLDGVSCVGKACVAAGYFYHGTPVRTLLERWTGSAWQLDSSAGALRTGTLFAVSCRSSTSCVAVGSPALAWNGVSWRVIALTSPFSAVSCATPTACMATGELPTGGLPGYGRWNGLRWQTGRVAAPPPHQGQSVTIGGVSCPTPGFCMAAGNYAYGPAEPGPQSRNRTLAEEWTGATWRVLRTVNVGPLDELTAVSCTAPDACTAVGMRAAGQFPLAERWNGTSWRAENMPAPGELGYTTLSAVSCVSARACTAVGDYQGLPVAYGWNGSRWRLTLLPRPKDDDNSADLNGVSCASAMAAAGPAGCMAVGTSGDAQSYAELWNGIAWRLVSTQNPG
jgi:hypothetical protein